MQKGGVGYCTAGMSKKSTIFGSKACSSKNYDKSCFINVFKEFVLRLAWVCRLIDALQILMRGGGLCDGVKVIDNRRGAARPGSPILQGIMRAVLPGSFRKSRLRYPGHLH